RAAGCAGDTAASTAGTAQRVALPAGTAAATTARADHHPIRQGTGQRRTTGSRDPYVRGTATTGAVTAVVAPGPAVSPTGVAPPAGHAAVGTTEPAQRALPAGGPVVLPVGPARRRAVHAPTGHVDLQ